MAYDPDARDHLLRQPRPGDDNPAGITVIQAFKCAAIIDSYWYGHQGWAPHIPTIVDFLQTAAYEAQRGPGIMLTTADQHWQKIDELPWPMPGQPRKQPD